MDLKLFTKAESITPGSLAIVITHETTIDTVPAFDGMKVGRGVGRCVGLKLGSGLGNVVG